MALRFAWIIPAILSVVAVASVQYNFLLFHILAELFAIIIAFILFATAVQTFRYTEDRFLTYLGSGYAWVAGIDIFHSLAYKGMNVLPDAAPDAAIRFWLMGRYMEAVLIVSAVALYNRLPHYRTALMIYGVGFAAAIWFAASDFFPLTHIEGDGLTPFKVWSEYILIAVFLGVAAVLFFRPPALDRVTTSYMFAAALFTAMAEYSFTLYIDVFELTNMMGHTFKIFSYWMIYQAVVRQHLEEPFLERFRTEAASKAKNEFMASMSHDLRTPLNAIIGFSQMMEAKALGPLNTPAYEEYIRHIMNSAHHLTDLINDILDLSKIESGRFEIGTDPVLVHDALSASVMMAGPSGKQKGVSVQLDGGQQDVGHVLLSSERVLVELFNNLLSNSVRYSDPGTTVTAKYQATVDGLHVHIEDQGIGMSEEQIQRAMQPFERLDSAHASQHKGTGLGLYICTKIMEMHGGEMTLQSAPGIGTTATLFFPVERLLTPQLDPETA